MNGQLSNMAQVASIRRYILADGAEKGIEVLDCNNGRIRFLLNVSAALDMMQMYHLGENLSFISKNGFVARDLPFARRFEGGMLYTCGLDSVGARDGFVVHGSLHQTPAMLTHVECNERELVIEATVKSSALFGEALVLKRRFSCPVGGDVVYLQDTLCNEGYLDAPYCLLYHVNVGYPMLCEGGTVEIDAAECRPRTAWSAEKLCEWQQITAPLPGQEETCYFIKPSTPRARYRRPDGKCFTLSYSGDTLPNLIEWKSMACGDFALGLEPCTTLLDGEFAYCHLAPGKAVNFSLCFEIS